MTRPRVSIRSVMALVALAAVGFAALRHADAILAGLVRLLTFALLAASILGVAGRRGASRAGRLGFALFGFGYAALTLAPESRPERLPTDELLGRLYLAMSPSRVVAVEPFAAASWSDAGRFTSGVEEAQVMVLDADPPPGAWPVIPRGSDAVVAVGTLDLRAFRAIGHCLLALAAGLIGAVIAGSSHLGSGRRPA